MSEPVVVAESYVWSHYPGMRAGRLYAGKPDLTQHPSGATHLVAGPDAALTVCGLPRTGFPREFAETVSLGPKAVACTACRPGGWPGPVGRDAG